MIRRVSRNHDRMSKWGDARANFRQLSLLSEAATRFLRDNHPLFAQTIVNVATKNSLVSNVSTDVLNDGDFERQPARRGRPRKSNQFYEDREEAEPRFIQKKRLIDDPEAINDDGQRRKRNVGIPRHFENMVMIENKKRKFDSRERDDDDAASLQAYDPRDPALDQAAKRKRGRPLKAHETATQAREQAPRVPVIQTSDEIMHAPKRLTFPEFCDQLRDFFRVLGAWYGVSAPVILHYLREQILPVLRVLSATQLPKTTINELYDQISRTLSYREIAPSFLSLLSIGRGFPFYAAIVHTLKIYDPDNLYGMRSMHYFVEPPPIQVITIYLRKVVEALNSPNGRETFKEIATVMDEIITEWKDYSIPLERRLEKIVKIDQLLPDHCRGLRARLYHVLMLPTTIMSKVLLQQQLLDEGHVLGTADSMVGAADAKVMYTIGYESLKETGIVPSGIPNTVLFNNVAYIKPVTMHPALQTVAALGVEARVEQPVPVINRVYDKYPTPEAGPMFATNGSSAPYTTSFASVPIANVPASSPPTSSSINGHHAPGQSNGPVSVSGYPQNMSSSGYGGGVYGASTYPYNSSYSTGAYPTSNGYGGGGSNGGNRQYKQSAPPSTNAGAGAGYAAPNRTSYDAWLNAPVGGSVAPPPPSDSYLHQSTAAHQYQPIPIGSYQPPSPRAMTQLLKRTTAAVTSAGSAVTALTVRAAAEQELEHQKESLMVKEFLEQTKEAVKEQYMSPFLMAVKELVRMLRTGDSTQDDLEAKILLLQSFVPLENQDFRDLIERTFTPENIKPHASRPPSSTGQMLGNNPFDFGGQAQLLSPRPLPVPMYGGQSAPQQMLLPSIRQMSEQVPDLPNRGNPLLSYANTATTSQQTAVTVQALSASNTTTSSTFANQGAHSMGHPAAARPVQFALSQQQQQQHQQQARFASDGSYGVSVGPTGSAPRIVGTANYFSQTYPSTRNPMQTSPPAMNWGNPSGFGPSSSYGSQPRTFGYSGSASSSSAQAPIRAGQTYGQMPVNTTGEPSKKQKRKDKKAIKDAMAAAQVTTLAPSASAVPTFAPSTLPPPMPLPFSSALSATTALTQPQAHSELSSARELSTTTTTTMESSSTMSTAAPAGLNPPATTTSGAKVKTITLDGITFPIVAPVPYPDAPVSLFANPKANDLFGPEPIFEGGGNSQSASRRAVLLAGPAMHGEDKGLQLKKAVAFYFDMTNNNYELSLTVLAEKFRVSHAKTKLALQREVDLRTSGWSERACNKLQETLLYYNTKAKKGSHTLLKAAEQCHVPYPNLLVWFIRNKASVNRFRTKPDDFKAKLKDMFIAYFKSEAQGQSETRSAIARRFMMTTALFSRKLMDLTDEQRTEYTAAAHRQLAVEKGLAAAAAYSAAAAAASAAGLPAPGSAMRNVAVGASPTSASASASASVSMPATVPTAPVALAAVPLAAEGVPAPTTFETVPAPVGKTAAAASSASASDTSSDRSDDEDDGGEDSDDGSGLSEESSEQDSDEDEEEDEEVQVAAPKKKTLSESVPVVQQQSYAAAKGRARQVAK